LFLYSAYFNTRTAAAISNDIASYIDNRHHLLSGGSANRIPYMATPFVIIQHSSNYGKKVSNKVTNNGSIYR
jgi:hypothetical protein